MAMHRHTNTHTNKYKHLNPYCNSRASLKIVNPYKCSTSSQVTSSATSSSTTATRKTLLNEFNDVAHYSTISSLPSLTSPTSTETKKSTPENSYQINPYLVNTYPCKSKNIPVSTATPRTMATSMPAAVMPSLSEVCSNSISSPFVSPVSTVSDGSAAAMLSMSSPLSAVSDLLSRPSISSTLVSEVYRPSTCMTFESMHTSSNIEQTSINVVQPQHTSQTQVKPLFQIQPKSPIKPQPKPKTIKRVRYYYNSDPLVPDFELVDVPFEE